MTELIDILKILGDPVYVVLVLIIFWQQRQIGVFMGLITKNTSSLTELSTLVKILVKGQEG